MFNLANLNDYEFELLCKDIMEVKLNCPLQIFPKGPDGGIDICDKDREPEIIIQVKHYINSKYSDLIYSLKKEIPKVQKLCPKEYYICSGLGLTKKQRDEIFSLFNDYMKDCSHIIDSIEINDFLSDEQNISIVNKHYKLWLCSSSILSLLNNRNVFFDCEELICEIEKESPLFVQTTSYFKAKKKLQENGIVIIIGAPGVGKSIVSKMLLLYYANEGCVVRYTSDNDISNIKKVLSTEPNKKEIILLDDFLGQHYLKIKDSQPNELKALLSYVKRNPNKKLIMNSRITIIKEAKQAYINFRHLMDENRNNEYLIDLDEISELEKAKILYNHLYFNSLPQDYFYQIKNDKNYFKIIRHKNYNPRIIEYIAMKINYTRISPHDYFQYIIEKLDNPEDVWRDEFRNRLCEPDRILLNTLYSLTNTWIDIKILEKSFNKRIREELKITTSLNTFREVNNRLVESLLRLKEEKGVIKVSALNPSINDYLNADICSNTNEQVSIITYSAYIEQVFKVTKSEESKHTLKEFLFSGKLLKMECLCNSPFFYFVKAIVDYEIYDERLEKNLNFALVHFYENVMEVDDYSDIFTKIMSLRLIQFYHIENILLNSNLMYYILRPIEYDFLKNISDRYIIIFRLCDNNEYNNVLVVFRDFIVERMYEIVKVKAEEDMYQIASDNISDFENEYGEIDDDGLKKRLISEAIDMIDELIYDEICIFNVDIGLTTWLFDVDFIVQDIDFGDVITSVKQERIYDYEDDKYMADWKSEYGEICNMFER